MGTRRGRPAQRLRAAKIGHDKKKLADSVRLRPEVSAYLVAKLFGIGRRSDEKKGSSRQFTDQYPW